MIKHILLIFVNFIYLLATIYFLHSQINIYSLKIHQKQFILIQLSK